MRIYYSGHGTWGSTPAGLKSEPNLLALSGNNWDDFGTKSTLNASLYFEGKRFEFEFVLQVLIEGCDYTAEKLNELKESDWDGFFPIPETNYISLPSDIDFYTTLVAKLGKGAALKVVLDLKDAGYLLNISQDEKAKKLIETKGFTDSLLRESGANKAYKDGWRIFEGRPTEIEDFDLNILTHGMRSRTIPFRFQSDLLPYDINVLIGANGIGKSYTIKSLVEYWLQTGIGEPKFLKKQEHTPFSTYPNISKLILVSYSPFEEFTMDLEDVRLQGKKNYRYFGLRYKKEDGSAGINQNLPKLNSAESIIKSIYDDEKFNFISDRVKKLPTTISTLSEAFDFDYLALEVNKKSEFEFYDFNFKEIGEKTYLPLNTALAKAIDEEDLIAGCDLTSGVNFLRDDELVTLSSGQQLFSFIVINVLGELRDNSLVVIDEPELFLHPTLEIQFISLLKEVLKPFASKAILATHSLAVVREVPSKCVHIFRKYKDDLDIIPPPFETFGGSVQRISSYVFGDKSVTKPFDNWLEEKMKDDPNAEKLIAALGEEINEELMMKISRIGRRSNGS